MPFRHPDHSHERLACAADAGVCLDAGSDAIRPRPASALPAATGKAQKQHSQAAPSVERRGALWLLDGVALSPFR